MERKLIEIKVNKKRIVLYMLMRLPWLALFVFGMFMAHMSQKGTANPNYVMIGVILLFMIIYICSPLRHLADVLTYYEHKIVFNKKEITFQNPSEIGWTRMVRYYEVFIGPRLIMNGKAEKKGIKEIFFPSNQIDVTYMDMAKEQFVRCYFNQVNTMK